MDGPGTITWEEFVQDAEELARTSKLVGDHWLFLGDKTCPGQAYLSRQETTWVPIDYPIDDSHSDADDPEFEVTGEWSTKFDINPDPFEASYPEERPLIVEHHVLWSMSYAVPVIYFNGWKSDYPGVNPISVEVAQRLSMKDKMAYAELSQAIHPLLGRPYLYLHPCGSQLLIQNMSKSTNKIVSWLSAIAPAALNLRLHPNYFRLTTGGDNSNGHCED